MNFNLNLEYEKYNYNVTKEYIQKSIDAVDRAANTCQSQDVARLVGVVSILKSIQDQL